MNPSVPETIKVDDVMQLRQTGLECYAQGDLDGARRSFEAALVREPLNADILGDLAALALQAGAVDAAIAHARRALLLEPAHVAAAYTLADALRHSGQYEEAALRLRSLIHGPQAAQLREEDPALADAAKQSLLDMLLQGQDGPPITIVDPRSLPLHDRFDIVLKTLYAQYRLGMLTASRAAIAQRLYAQHIHVRTGGAEPGDEARKASIDDFIAHFDALIASMARDGFDPTYPVPYSRENGLPLNGAHRVAAALAIGCDIAVQMQPGEGGRWDMEWFRTHGFARDDRDLLLHTWAGIKAAKASIVLLWSPVETHWDALECDIARTMSIVEARTIELPRAGFNELVHDIYSFDWGPRTGANIARKVDLLAPHPPRLRVLFCELAQEAPTDAQRQLKLALRDAYAQVSPVDHFTTLHVSESEAETRHLLRIFANRNNLHRLRQRKPLRAEFVDLLVEMRSAIDARAIAVDDCCVVGSSILEVFGLRPADDVDFTLKSAIRFAQFDGGVTHLSPRVDVVSFNYPRSFSATQALTDDEMIADPAAHFHVRGVRFADPDIVLTRKQHQRRDKDLRDVALLGRFMERDPE